MAIVGIDLGTTYSAVACLDKAGTPRLIPNAEGELLTPSVVYFSDNGEIVVGRLAKNSSDAFPEQTVEFVKTDMGSSNVYQMVGKNYSPEHISALILEKIIKNAEVDLGEKITGAVITVPAIFGNEQREATKRAAEIAGIELLALLNEPEAAAIHYGLLLKKEDADSEDQCVLVCDLGGGTFDVTVLKISGNALQTLITDGNRSHGGKLWDDAIIDYVAKEFEKEHKVNPLESLESRQALRLAVEDAKKGLTNKSEVPLKCVHEGRELRIILKRDKFNELTSKLLKRTEEAMTSVVGKLFSKNVIKGWDEIDQVLLVGGSSKMKQIPDMVRRVTGKEPKLFDPDHAVAKGAASYAVLKVLSKSETESSAEKSNEILDKHSIDPNDFVSMCRLTVTSVTSFAVGVKTIKPGFNSTPEKPEPLEDDYFNAVMIERNAPLPAVNTRPFETICDNQSSIRLPILEGDSFDPGDCLIIGEGVITKIPPLKKGTPLTVTIQLTDESLIEVSADVPSVPDSGIRFEIRRNKTSAVDVSLARADLITANVS